MVQENMGYYPGLVGRGQARPLNASHLDKVTLKQDTEVTVYAQQVSQDKLRYWGFGGKNRQAADTKTMYADFDATGVGAANAAGDPVTGELVAAITDSDQRRVLASRTIGSLDELAAAKDDKPTERPVMYALAPYAKPGRHLELRVIADADSDAYELGPGESEMQLWYGEI